MSAIGGIYSLRGAPIPEGTLESLSTLLEPTGPDGESIDVRHPVGMVFRAFHTHDESRRVEQPVRNAAGLVLCWDGRLDNRRDLIRALGLPGTTAETAVVLAAFEAWGAEATGRLLGDFALALWNPDQQQLLLATDALGIRTLFYHQGREHLFWSSRVRPLLTAAGLPEDVDDEFVAGFLVRHRELYRSPFKRIERLPAGHFLAAQGGTLRQVRYYRPDLGQTLRYRSDAEYEEHFREVLTDAIACRMRSTGPVFAELSGGLDSSAIVCVGDEIARREMSPIPTLRTVSYVYDTSFRSDERRYIRPVEEQRGEIGLHIRDEEHPILRPPRYDSGFQPEQPNGQLAYVARHGFVADRMAAVGARVLLRGFGGDEVLWSTVEPGPPEPADLFRQKRFLAALAAGQRWAQALRMPFLRALWLGGLWPLLPRRLQRLASPYRSQDFYRKHAAFIAATFHGRVDLKDRILGPLHDPAIDLPSRRGQYSRILEMADFVVPDLYLEDGCTELRYPYFDRRLVEFMLTIPLTQKIRPGQMRSLQRRALRGTLPEVVRARRSKGGPEEAFHRALLREWPWLSNMLLDPLVVSHGYIDHHALSTTLQRARHGLHSGPLLRVLCLEFWLRSLDRHRDDRAVPKLSQERRYHSFSDGGKDHDNLRSA